MDQKKFEKISQCRKLSRSAEKESFLIFIQRNELKPMHYRMLVPIFIHASPILIHALRIIIHWLGSRLPILIHASPILIQWLGFRLPILIHAWPILIPGLGFRLHILILCRLVSATNQNRAPESSANHNREPSSANQNRVLRQPSRQPIRIEYYVTRELSARLEDPSRLLAWAGSL